MRRRCSVQESPKLRCVLVTFLTTAGAAASAAPPHPASAAPSLPAPLLLSSFPESVLLSSLAASDESSPPGALPVASSTQSATVPKGKVFYLSRVQREGRVGRVSRLQEHPHLTPLLLSSPIPPTRISQECRGTLKSADGGARWTCAQCREQLKELQEWFAGVEASKLGDQGNEGQQGGGGGRGGRGGAGGRGTEADDVMELQSRLVEKQGELKQLKAEYEALQIPGRAFGLLVTVPFRTTVSAAASAAPSLPAPLLLSSFPESFLLSSLASTSSRPGGLPVPSSTQISSVPKGKVFIRYAAKLRPPRSHGKILGDLAATGRYSFKGLEYV
ncbi:unnamed protein product [Closterium sp. Naga37s-1]|nr:unnamed protein product [Closterium sp. Naga37s-1]